MLTFYRVIPGDPPRLDEIARLDEADVESIESSFDAAEHIPFAPFEPDPGARGLDPEVAAAIFGARWPELRDRLLQLSPSAREKLRTVLMRDDRDDLAQMLLRYGIANGDKWAEVVNALTMYPDVRRRLVRALEEIDATQAD